MLRLPSLNLKKKKHCFIPVFRVKTRKGWIKRKIITKDLLEIRNPWGKAKWIGNDAVAEFSDRKKRSLGISNETEGGFYILMEDFIKVT